jgi:hypothetical protein
MLHSRVANIQGHVSNDQCCHTDSKTVHSGAEANGAAVFNDQGHPTGNEYQQKDETASSRASMHGRISEQISDSEHAIKLLLLPGSRLQEVP